MANRIGREPIDLLESPFKRHTYHVPNRSIFRFRNLAIAAIAISVFAVGAGAFTGHFNSITKAWAQTADTNPEAKGNTALTEPATTVVIPPIGTDGSQQSDLDERRKTEAADIERQKQAAAANAKARQVPANPPGSTGTSSSSSEDLLKAAADKIAALKAAQATTGTATPAPAAQQAQGAPAPNPAVAPATVEAAKAADKAALAAIAEAKTVAAEANAAKAELVKALNSGNAERIAKAAEDFKVKDTAALAAVAKAKEAVTNAKAAAKAADVVIVDGPAREVKDRKDLPVVSKIETVRPTKDARCDIDCMLARGYTQRPVLQKDQRVRRDWLCYGEEDTKVDADGKSITVCNKTQVSVVTAGTPDDE